MVQAQQETVPLVRIFTCGGLRIDVLEQPAHTPAQARYRSPAPVPGALAAQMVLRRLVSAPGRSRSLDWLREYWNDGGEEGPIRVDNAVSTLRGLLCPPYLEGKPREQTRRELVQSVEGSRGAAYGYRLAPYPSIWVDADALAWNVEQAARMQRFGDDPIPFWERAYTLVSAGPYLPEEDHLWIEPRRAAILGSRRSTVHALARLYKHFGEPGQAELERILRDHLIAFPIDEDVLRPLMELLGEQERFSDLRQTYHRSLHFLEEDGQVPEPQTRDLWEYLQAKQIQRGRTTQHASRPQTIAHSVDFFVTLREYLKTAIVSALEQREQQLEENASDLF